MDYAVDALNSLVEGAWAGNVGDDRKRKAVAIAFEEVGMCFQESLASLLTADSAAHIITMSQETVQYVSRNKTRSTSQKDQLFRGPFVRIGRKRALNGFRHSDIEGSKRDKARGMIYASFLYAILSNRLAVARPAEVTEYGTISLNREAHHPNRGARTMVEESMS